MCAVILDSTKVSKVSDIVIDPRIQVIFSDRLTDAQKNSGIQAKVTIVHPCFTTRATVFKGEKGGLRVIGSSMKLNEKDWFNIVTIEAGFRDRILAMYKEFQAGKVNRGAWYLEMKGDKVIHVDTENKNETIDLEEIILNANLSDKQAESNMVAKVSIKTPIATLRGVSVYQSKFGQSLYLMEQLEDKTNQIPAYSLSRECEAQVLNHIHAMVTDWGTYTPRAEKPPVEQAVENAVGATGQPEHAGAVDENAYYQ